MKEYVFKKKPEKVLEEKKEIAIDSKEEKKITINSDKIHNEKLKSLYEGKIVLYNCFGIFLLVFGLFLILNTTLYFFDLHMTKLFLYSKKSYLETLFPFFMGILSLRCMVQTNKKVEKYKKLLNELK